MNVTLSWGHDGALTIFGSPVEVNGMQGVRLNAYQTKKLFELRNNGYLQPGCLIEIQEESHFVTITKIPPLRF